MVRIVSTSNESNNNSAVREIIPLRSKDGPNPGRKGPTKGNGERSESSSDRDELFANDKRRDWVSGTNSGKRELACPAKWWRARDQKMSKQIIVPGLPWCVFEPRWDAFPSARAARRLVHGIGCKKLGPHV